MSIIEFQVSASAFLGAQRNALRLLALCPPAVPPVSGVQVVVDRVDFMGNALRHDEADDFPVFYYHHGEMVGTPNPATGFRTQLRQDVTLYLTTEQAILARPNQQPAVLVPVTATLVFDLDLYVFDDDCYLRASLSQVALGPVPPLPPPFSPLTSLPAGLRSHLETFLTQHARLFASSGTVPLGLGALSKATPKFLNAGISVDTQMQRVAFRVQIGGSHTNLDVPWSNFFQGFFPDRLQGSDWSMFVEAGLLTETVKAVVYQRLPVDDNLQAFPGCTYFKAGNRAVLELDILLIYHLYRNIDLDIDLKVSAHPRAQLHLWVDSPNWISTEFDFSRLPESNDPLVNVALGLARFLGVPVEELLFRIAGSMAMGELSKSPLENCKQPSPTKIRCDKRVRVPHAPGALQTALTGLLALDDGIALIGSMNVRELTPAVLQTSVREFRVHAPSISCGGAGMSLVAAFRSDPSNFAVLHAQAYVQNTGTAPLRLCSPPMVMRGADGPFPVSAVRVDGQHSPLTIRFDIGAPPDAYYDAAYPLDALLRTSGGTRLVRIQPPPRVTREDHEGMVAELIMKIGDCQQLVDGWFGTHRGYNPLWGPRPPEDAIVRQLWQIVVSGLPAGDTVTLLDSDDRPIVSAVSAGSTLRLSTMTDPRAGGNELSIVRGLARHGLEDSEPGSATVADSSERGLEVRQTNLVHRGTIPLLGGSRRLLLGELLDTSCVVAVTEKGVTVLDVGTSERATLVASWHTDGINGALRWHTGVVVFGDHGIARVDRAGRWVRQAAPCDHDLVLDAAADQHGLYALTDERVDVYSRKLCQVGQIPVDGATSVACVDGRLIVGGRRGLAVFTTAEHRPEDYQIETGDRGVTAVMSASLAEPGSFLVVFEDATSRLLRFGERHLEELARYEALPWFVGALRLGDRLVMAGEGGSLDTYELGETAVL